MRPSDVPTQTPRDAALDEVALLTEYAVSARYPGEAEDVTDEELLVAVSTAERVLKWASSLAAG